MITQQAVKLYDGDRAMSVSQSSRDDCNKWMRKSVAVFGNNSGDDTKVHNRMLEPVLPNDAKIHHGWGEYIHMSDGNRIMSLRMGEIFDQTDWLKEMISIYQEAPALPAVMMSIGLVDKIYTFKITPVLTSINLFDMATLPRNIGRFDNNYWDTVGKEYVDDIRVLDIVGFYIEKGGR